MKTVLVDRIGLFFMLTKKIAFPINNPSPYVLFILISTFIVYLPSIFNGFVNWDDDVLILNNPLVQVFPGSNLRELFTSHIQGRYYPLTLLAFQIEYFLFNFRPLFFHIINLFLHLLNIILVFQLLKILKVDFKIIFFTMLLFAWHPLQVEAVAWISSLKDVLFSFFYLTAVLCYTKSRLHPLKSWFYYDLSLLFFILSLFTKSAAISLPITLFLIDYYINCKLRIKDISNKIPFFFAALLCGLLTLHYADIYRAFPASRSRTWIDSLLFSNYAFFLYLAKLIAPLHLSCIYPLPDKWNGFYSPLIYLSLFFPLLFVLYVICIKKKVCYPVWISILFFFITLFPMLHIIRINTGIIFERFVYLSSLGVFLLLSIGYCYVYSSPLVKRLKIHSLLRLLMTGYFLFLFATTWNRCYVWKDSISLWNDAIRKFPLSPNGYMNRSNAKMIKGEWNEALRDIQIAIKIDKNNANAYLGRAVIYEHLQNYGMAMEDYSAALRLGLTFQEDIVKSYNNRGNLYSYQDRPQLAINDYNEALRLDPMNIFVLLNRGMEYYEQKNYKASLMDFNSVLKKLPNQPFALKMRSKISEILKGNEE